MNFKNCCPYGIDLGNSHSLIAKMQKNGPEILLNEVS